MKTIFYVVLSILMILGAYYFIFIFNNDTEEPTPDNMGDSAMGNTQPLSDPTFDNPDLVATSTVDDPAEVVNENKPTTVIGNSVGGNEIVAYHFGSGETELLFVGGIHGGYEWNTVLVAYELIDYLKANPEVIPENITVTVLPVLNPDGLMKTVGTTDRFTSADVPSGEGATIPGRFNNNEVDLNRNFDCDWQSVGTWKDVSVDGGSSAFSEPESKAFKAYIESNTPSAVVVWYSSAGGVFASNCHNGVLPETTELTTLFSNASGYKAYEEFNFYEITGDMVNWLAKINIPAISVLLTTHESTEWTKNKAGIDALLKYYTE